MENRRYDIDWVRVIAIGLLLIYHTAIGFQPWGAIIGFVTNSKPWKSLWIPMAMLNVWRIPLLFFVSGIGVSFSLQNRNWKALITERTKRVLIPFVFGMLFIVPLHMYLMQFHYLWEIRYAPNAGHLWFLGNIFSYTLILSPILFYLKRNEDGKLAVTIRQLFSSPIGLLVVIAAFQIEAVIIKPNPYELYAMTWHGFLLGLLAFFFGYCFVSSGSEFWNMLSRWRVILLILATSFFIYRLIQFQMRIPIYLVAVESNLWVFTIFAFAHRYLNQPSKTLTYLSEAAYPIYIIHMIFLYLASLIIFPLDISVPLKFVLALAFTSAGCFAFYESIIRRINPIRPFFGLKQNKP